MEIAPHPHRDIHPQALLEQYESVLRDRMGDRNFERRYAIEELLNPSGQAIKTKLRNLFMHCVYLTTLNISLSLLRKRRISIKNCWDIEVTSNNLQLENFPSGSSLRILHLSDFHLDTRLEQATSWASRIKDLEYDFAVITGDFFNGYRLPNTEELNAVKTILQAVSKPVYGILGNHDCMLMTPFLEAMGITMLINESVEIDIEGVKLLITGLDDSNLFKSDDLAFATRELKPNEDHYALSLILAHSPKNIWPLKQAGYDLCLSGHTHGGQLCTSEGLPLLRNRFYRAGTISGSWELDTLKGYTSRGTGTGRITFRLNCRPEIVLHEIRGF